MTGGYEDVLGNKGAKREATIGREADVKFEASSDIYRCLKGT